MRMPTMSQAEGGAIRTQDRRKRNIGRHRTSQGQQREKRAPANAAARSTGDLRAH